MSGAPIMSGTIQLPIVPIITRTAMGASMPGAPVMVGCRASAASLTRDLFGLRLFVRLVLRALTRRRQRYVIVLE
jgi:hypothetical protein